MRFIVDRDQSDTVRGLMQSLVLPYQGTSISRIDARLVANERMTRIVHIDILEVEWCGIEDNVLHTFDYDSASHLVWAAMSDSHVAFLNLVRAMAEFFMWEHDDHLDLIDWYRCNHISF